MADYCLDCLNYDNKHDLPDERGWYLCEGCGLHIFVMGVRLCRRGPIPPSHAAIDPCPDCASFIGTDEGP
jgi:hypothetical protein